MQGTFLPFKIIFKIDKYFLELRFLFNNLWDIFLKYFLLSCSVQFLYEISLENNGDVMLNGYHYDEFFINRIFVINHIFYIFIKPWRVPIVKNHCFVRDKIAHNVHNSFIK